MLRAKIVLYAAQGLRNDEIAARLDTRRVVISKWRKRFYEQRLAGLEELPRTGRPPVFPPELVVQVKAIACELPAKLGMPLARLHVPDIREEILARGLVADISDTTIWRWLADDALRPWTFRSWIFPRDPAFADNVGRVLDLYHRIFEGEPLGAGDYVLSANEKTSIRARCRCHPTMPPGKARALRVQHEYERRGAVAYLATWDVHRAKVLGRCEETSRIAAFMRLVDDVMTTEPDASAGRVFWVVDNASSHRGQAAVDRMHDAYPNAHLVHLPNYFSVVQLKVLTPNDCTLLEEIEA